MARIRRSVVVAPPPTGVDDTARLAADLAMLEARGGGVWEFPQPEATYLISGTLALPDVPITWRANKATIQSISSEVNPLVAADGLATGHLNIEGLRLRGSGKGAGQTGVQMTNGLQHVFRQMRFNNLSVAWDLINGDTLGYTEHNLWDDIQLTNCTVGVRCRLTGTGKGSFAGNEWRHLRTSAVDLCVDVQEGTNFYRCKFDHPQFWFNQNQTAEDLTGFKFAGIMKGLVVDGSMENIVPGPTHGATAIRITETAEMARTATFRLCLTNQGFSVIDNATEEQPSLDIQTGSNTRFWSLSNGTDIAYFGATPKPQQVITGSTTDEKVDSILNALKAYGLVVDGTDGDLGSPIFHWQASDWAGTGNWVDRVVGAVATVSGGTKVATSGTYIDNTATERTALYDSVWLDGVNDYILLPAAARPALGEGDALTVMVVLRYWQNTAFGRIFSSQSANATTSVGVDIRFRAAGAGNFNATVGDGSAAAETADMAISAGQYGAACAVVESGSVVAASALASTVSPPVARPTGDASATLDPRVGIRAGSTTQNPSAQEVVAVLMWDRALTLAERLKCAAVALAG